MKKILPQLITQIGTLATFLGLALTYNSNFSEYTGWQWFIIFLFVVLFFVSIYLIIEEYYRGKPKEFNNSKEIRDYMYDWIINSGRTVIFTRDMSWVVDDDMIQMLLLKSQKKELIICMPKKIDIVDQFIKSGADLIEYAKFDYIPTSRFTVTNYGRTDAKIAVGHTISSEKHIIEEFKNGEHPYFYVVNDLVNILDKYCKL